MYQYIPEKGKKDKNEFKILPVTVPVVAGKNFICNTGVVSSSKSFLWIERPYFFDNFLVALHI